MQRQVSKRTADRQRSAASGRGQVKTENEGEEVCKLKVNKHVQSSVLDCDTPANQLNKTIHSIKNFLLHTSGSDLEINLIKLFPK